ncbi:MULTISPECIES: 3-hydroxyacyl-CoA dehydrogenase NAD-binding domain-containing protein [unclassified Methylobacterium]|uniref:3-hydroxyacyl-CoA dehydrogenase NAD-binding domain-containing protein n=1 Tax=unclassified Methylobacterium TaxID=2615210 RepID=UPI0006F6D4C0|nr:MULTISPECIES: 3-hydroxyacyl-CoA dehydrogenase NAD-binding domain-containing protein [unclassified Methylobacterium]KQP81004.1 3-hydroxyacyl-CoA dehydrogenase [Methylobacterium sp. Leaf117]MCK2055228.1 enoyl-CoA hydratase/isomerase family protein [Methylobacterium sp. 37f]
MNLTNFRLETDADGIALATWDMPGRSMNVFTDAVMDELGQIIDAVVADAAIKGCVIVSGKDNFSGGADLTMLQGLGRAYEALKAERGEEAAMRHFFDESRKLTLVFRKLETCGKPFAAAVNGICLGGAFELALACHHRVLSDDPKTRVGLPEIKVGLFPGGGGTQRVARLMQTGDALQMLFKGEQIRPAMAKNMGLAQEVAPRDEIVARAKAWIAAGGSAVAPWDQPKFKAPSGKVYSPAGMMIWPPANAIYRRETHDNYPAAKAILASVYEGLQLPMDQALRVESRYFAHILRTKEAAAMIRTLFLSMGELNKGARRPKDVPATVVKTVGVVGAGFMGAGVAYVSANAGMEVVLVDQSIEAAEKGKAYAHKLVTDQINKGRAKTADREALLGRIRTSADYADLGACDLVIEAVFEDPKVKAEVIAKVEAAIRPETIFASNTSTLPITGLAKTSSRPEQFVGIHFFSPVEKMMLVEIIKGDQTGDAALATALDYVRAIKKTPIVVNDARGFFANRCVGAYLLEGHTMLNEGIPAAMIENAGRQAGMPVGPLSLTDEVAVDLALKIVKATEAQLGAGSIDPAQKALLTTLVEGEGRLGRKNKKGFYDYPEGAPKRLWPGLAALQATKVDPDAVDFTELKQRLLVVQALEAARTVGEGVVTDPREADVGSILGFGFAPFTGGALSYIDFMGAQAFVTLAQGLEAKHGPRFAVPQNLLDMAARGGTFYGDAAAKKAA